MKISQSLKCICIFRHVHNSLRNKHTHMIIWISPQILVWFTSVYNSANWNDINAFSLNIAIEWFIANEKVFVYCQRKTDWITWWVVLIEQEPSTLPEHLSKHPEWCGVYVIVCLFVPFLLTVALFVLPFATPEWGRRGRGSMVIGFTTTCAISAYITTKVMMFELRSWPCVLGYNIMW